MSVGWFKGGLNFSEGLGLGFLGSAGGFSGSTGGLRQLLSSTKDGGSAVGAKPCRILGMLNVGSRAKERECKGVAM